jgi:hypothetical protein
MHLYSIDIANGFQDVHKILPQVSLAMERCKSLNVTIIEGSSVLAKMSV